jgi:hypothetical protein
MVTPVKFGRPRLKEPKNQRVGVPLTELEKDGLYQACDFLGMSAGQLFRVAARLYIQEQYQLRKAVLPEFFNERKAPHG